ncbi:hypothetical protein [Paludisphaera rhizosphaerae]|uniref:hypothetical protein n=1 Tax=Paludisphaera rhizosphaerae TaxID=2711216 RepID=UPI0013ED046A|nr:hypothetical protein [Paludisphaera rhizosphaerae]
MRHTVWIGALVGLIAGLLLWLDSATREQGAGATRIDRSSPRRSTSSGTGGVLGATEEDDKSAIPPKTPAVDEPRAAAVRSVWKARLLLHDYRGAHEIIEKGGMKESSRDVQLGDLADGLIPDSWIATPNFPRSQIVRDIMSTTRGTEDLSDRWRVANEVIDGMPPGPRKVGLLTRLELATQVVSTAISDARSIPALQEVDAVGRPKTNPAASGVDRTSVAPFETEKEAARLRKRIVEEVEKVHDDSFLTACWNEMWASWNFIRTCLLTAAGAGLMQLFKTASESLGTRVGQISPLALKSPEPKTGSGDSKPKD